MFSELGGSVMVQGSPRAGVSVATYTNGGLASLFRSQLSGFTGVIPLLAPLSGPTGFYVLRWFNLTPVLTGGAITVGPLGIGNLLNFSAGSETSYDMAGVVVRDLEAACAAPTVGAATFALTVRYDLIFAEPGIS